MEIAELEYLSVPESGSGPGVLVIHSGRGVTPFIRQLCQRFARHGFVAMAIDLFDGKTAETPREAAELKNAIDWGATMNALENAVSGLLQMEMVEGDDVGLVGLGYGAGWALWLGDQMPSEIGAIVIFYGYREGSWSDIEAPVMGHFAEIDTDIPPSRVDDIRDELWASGIHTDFFVYGRAEPSFFEEDESASHSPRAAQLAWERTVRFLEINL